MSRIGRKAIKIPPGVEVDIQDQKVKVKGPKGTLDFQVPLGIKAEIQDGIILLKPERELTKQIKALWGTCRQVIFNMIEGVVKGFEKKLEIEGVGFKAQVKDNNLILDVGFSHQVEIKSPPGIYFNVDKNIITVSGIDKQLVGQVAAQIRKVKKVEPYKGKGIKYVGEYVRKKAGKKAVGA